VCVCLALNGTTVQHICVHSLCVHMTLNVHIDYVIYVAHMYTKQYVHIDYVHMNGKKQKYVHIDYVHMNGKNMYT